VDGGVYWEKVLEGIKSERKGSISFLTVAIYNRVSFLLYYFEVVEFYHFLF